MKNELRTCDWRDRTEIAETIGDLRALLISLEQCGHDWSRFFINEMTARGIKTLKMASLCGVSRQTIAHWKGQNHLPRSREQYINIAMAFGMNIDETNHLLQRYGVFPKLYARNIRDAVRIYAIQSRLKRTPEAIEYAERGIQGFARAHDAHRRRNFRSL